MNTLIMIPRRRSLEYALAAGRPSALQWRKQTGEYQGLDQEPAILDWILSRIAAEAGVPLDGIAIRAVYGGTEFSGPVRADDAVQKKLEALIPQAPLDAGAALRLLESCQRVLPETPVQLFFETAFFAGLPAREYLYAVETGPRRFGFHGLYHQAATAGRGQRVISVCLGPRPEVAAVMGGRPVMVTSGSTPLEGLPGETVCGDMDPGLVLALAEAKKWGPEQVNRVLAEQSGLAALAGAPATLEQVFTQPDRRYQPARDVMRYRLLLACGAAAAALGGADRIVFSGRSARLGKILGPYLSGKLQASDPMGKTRIPWEVYDTPLAQILAERAAEAGAREKIAA